MRREAKEIYRVALGPDCAAGTFFAPQAFEIDGLARLEQEVFGPILHVVRFRQDRLDQLLDGVDGAGLWPDAGHPQPHRCDGAPYPWAARASATPMSTAT